MNSSRVTVIGAGLAGCEAANTLANAGVAVTLCEMKPHKKSPAHKSDDFAELVCSNSLGADRIASASGLLKAEMRRLGSLLLNCADKARVPAGGALAVDRDKFARLVTGAMEDNPLIEIKRGEVAEIPEGWVVIATGPLTSDALADRIAKRCGAEYLSFYDAAAPIVTAESLDDTQVFRAARYGRGDDDYINCPMNKEEYEAFYAALIQAEQAPLHELDKQVRVYEGCIPVEILARRGQDTLRYGPLKPVGLTDPRTGRRPWAVVQLRAENAAGTLYNLVGFQTNLKFPEQKRVFSMIPGLGQAEFARYGVMHRNTFLDSPRLLNRDFSLRSDPRIFFAGQITGTEGYMESAAGGIVAALQLIRRMRGETPVEFPKETLLGALSRTISDDSVKNFQPMGASMGLLPPLSERVKDKQERYARLAEQALAWYETGL